MTRHEPVCAPRPGAGGYGDVRAWGKKTAALEKKKFFAGERLASRNHAKGAQVAVRMLYDVQIKYTRAHFWNSTCLFATLASLPSLASGSARHLRETAHHVDNLEGGQPHGCPPRWPPSRARGTPATSGGSRPSTAACTGARTLPGARQHRRGSPGRETWATCSCWWARPCP